MPNRDANDRRLARFRPAPGTCVHLKAAGVLTGHGSSHYGWTPSHFGPHLVIRGRGTFCWPAGRTEVKPGTLFALLPGMHVRYWEDPHEPWQYHWLHVEGEGVDDFARGCGFSPDSPVWQLADFAEIRRSMQVLRDCLGYDRPAHPYTVQAELYRFARLSARAARGLRRRDCEEGLIGRARALIDSQLHTGINVKEVAAILGVSRTTLFYAFRRELDESPVQFLRRRRIQQAKDMLRTEAPRRLRDVALACGFRDGKYFARTFRELTGQTPSQWRAAHASRAAGPPSAAAPGVPEE